MRQKIAPSKTANSTNRNETINDAGTEWLGKIIEVDYSYMVDDWIVFMLSAAVLFTSLAGKSIDLQKIGFTLEMLILMDSIAGIIGLEYLQNLEDENNTHALLLEIDFTRRLFSNLAWFVGGGIGLRFNFSSDGAQEDWKTGYLALKANTGFLVNISHLFTKIDVSYNNVTGFCVGTGIGFGLELY